MRLFWALIAILAAATAAVFALRGNPDQRPSPSPPASTPPRPATAPTPARGEPTPPPSDPQPQPTDAPAASAANTDEPSAEVAHSDGPSAYPTPEVVPQPQTQPDPDPDLTVADLNRILGITDPDAPPPAEEAVSPIAASDETATSPATHEAMPSEGASESTHAPAEPAPAPPPDAATPPSEAPSAETTVGAMFNGYEVVPAVRHTLDNGSLRLDDRFVLPGKGTEAEPYQITWELLISAQETLVPRSGKKKIPERLTMLEGQWVEITGNIAFPLMEEQPDELLCMLNAWDGCCIGVPPTPYDAIEVRLKRPVTGTDRFASYAGMKGKFFIKPYLVGEWLVGLYVMDNADMTAKQAGAESP